MWREFATLFFSLIAVCSSAQSDAWVQVRTPHFLIVSNAREKEARLAAHQFEGMRSVFQKVFPDANLDTAEPMLILAVQDKRSVNALVPDAYTRKGQIGIAGFFLAAPERNYVLILLNAPGSHPYAPIYHEYAHFVFSRLQQWMPLWLTEGIAEYYENTEILPDRVRVGKGDPYLQAILDRGNLLPFPTLFAVDQHSPYYHESDKTSVFYAESWALTHCLKDKDDHEGTHHLNDFLGLVQQNVDSATAAAQVFGDLDQLQVEVRKHALNSDYQVTDISGSTEIDDSSFSVQALSQTQADTARADFLAHDGRTGDARTLLTSVLHDDPASVSARETMGYAAYREGHYDEARKWCQEAIKLEPQNFVAHYCFAVASIRKGTPDKASQAAVEESLRTAIKLAPSFGLSYDALGMFYAIRGINLGEANQLMETAVRLLPGVPEVRVDQAQVLSAMNKDADAIAALELALKMAHTPEQTAAVENVLQTMRTLAEKRKSSRSHVDSVLLGRGGNPIPNSGGGLETGAGRASARETPPKAIYSPDAGYTDEARRAKLEGTCVIDLVVGLDGKATNIVVTKPLGLGLDQRAVETVKTWKFTPGTRNGRPVVSRMTLSLQFKLIGGDAEKFFDLSQKATAGDANAEYELANAFFEGRGIPKDETKGMALLERAARSGHTTAQFQMGSRIYGDGNDSDKYVKAYFWFVLAQRGGYEAANAKVSELESRMTPDQISEGRKALQTQP